MAEKQNYVGAFERHGIELIRGPGQNYLGQCPFCGKPEHFFVNPTTGKWDCKRCGQVGNLVTFLTMLAKETFATTAEADWQKLAADRGIPVGAFKKWMLGWTGTEWLLPAYSEAETVRDIRIWNGKYVGSTTGCKLQLYGLNKLARMPRGSTVWLCEGEWDTIAWQWVLDQLNRTDEIAIGVPGAASFKMEWARWLTGMHVNLSFDNDDAGHNGSIKTGHAISQASKSVRCIHWPSLRPNGWDLRDTVREGLAAGHGPQEIYDVVSRLLKDTNRDSSFLPGNTRPSSGDKTGPSPGKNEQSGASPETSQGKLVTKLPTYPEVLAVFKKWLKMDRDLMDCLAITLAVCLSNDVPGDPLWVYLVGPPSSGKTVILNSTEQSERVFFRSTLTPASLVSGFNVNPDPSVIPLMGGKTAVFKDGTELLALHQIERDKIYAILRGAFDGRVYKNFGNGVVRDYNVQFSLLVGVTPAIHGDNQATMGERFLKFEISEAPHTIEDKMRAALANIGREDQQDKELKEVVQRFLLRTTGDLPELPEWFKDRLMALAQLLARMRAKVDREVSGDRDIKYRPFHEGGMRVIKQLAKLGQMLAVVFDSEIDQQIMRIVERTAFHTMIDFHLDIVRSIILNGTAGSTHHELADRTGIPSGTIMRRLQDMEAMRIVVRIPIDAHETPGPNRGPRTLWQVSPTILDLWQRSRTKEQR